MESVLEIKNLRKQYEDFILQDVSFSLPRGYIMGLIGPNGAGKTTIIKLIMNLIMKDEGSIHVFGQDHCKHEVDIKSRIGFVYDNPDYYDHLTLKQLKNIIRPFYKKWDEAMFQRLASQFDLPQKKILKKFSRGMTMKAAIALTLSHHAEFIIMDEPTSGLDPVFRRELLDLLYEMLQDEKKSILFSTHITSDLERIADFITLIIRGQVVFSRPKDEVFEQYALVKGGNDLLTADTRPLFISVRTGAFGFEGLTEKPGEVSKALGDRAVVEKASLEDIMVFCNLRGKDA